MSNEVEIVVTGKNRAKPAVESAKRDAAEIGKSYRETGRTATTALGHIRDALRGGLRDAIADVNGDTNRLSRSVRAVQESVTRSLDTVKSSAGRKLREAFSEKDGKSAGTRMALGIVRGIGAGLRKITFTGLTEGVSGALKGALSSPIIGTVIVAALGIAAAAAAPAIAATISGGIVLGLGAGLVGAGAMALFHVEEINSKWSKAEQKRVAESNKQAEILRAQWRDLSRDIVGGLKDAAQPLLPVLDSVRSMLRGVGSEFQPVIEKGLQIAQGPLKRFVTDIGEAFLQLKPAVAPLMTSFGELLDQVGPMLPGLFADIADAIIEMAGTVSENKDLIAGLFIGLMETLPVLISLLSGLTSAFRTSLVIAAGFADGLLAVLQGIMEVIAQIPGPWQDSAAQIAASIQGTRDRLGAWKTDIENFPQVVTLEGDIRDLDSKIASARRQLNDKNLTKTRRAKLEAQIAQLLVAKARAQAAINALRGKSVTITVNTLHTFNGPPRTARAHGGIIGALGAKKFAQGGVSGAGGATALVGEQGPELVNLPFGSTVVAAGQTRAMGQGGFGSVSMAYKPGGSGAGGGIADAVEPLKEVAKALRDIVSLRDGMDKLSGSVFGQERALTAYEAAWDAARKSLKEHKKTLSMSTDAGRANRAALLSLAEGAQDVVIAMRDMGKPTTTIVKKMAEQRLEFIRMARAMGLTTKQAKALADRYGLIPKKVKTVLEQERKDLAYNKKAEAYNKKLAAQGKASGGIAGGWTVVGERGAELVRLPFGSSVTPAGQTNTMLGAGGRGGPTVLEIRSGGSRLDDLLVELLRRAVRTRGGDVQLVLGRS